MFTKLRMRRIIKAGGKEQSAIGISPTCFKMISGVRQSACHKEYFLRYLFGPIAFYRNQGGC